MMGNVMIQNQTWQYYVVTQYLYILAALLRPFFASDIESYIKLGFAEPLQKYVDADSSYGVNWQDPRCYFDEKTMLNHGDLQTMDIWLWINTY